MSSYYMKKSTYQKDFIPKMAPQFDKYGLSKSFDYSKPSFDDPAWQRGRNESSEQYEERLKELSLRQQEPDYYRTYEERKAHEEGRRPDRDAYRDGPMTERRSYDDMDKGRDYRDRDGPLTERGYNSSYLDHGNLTYRRYDKRDDPKSKNDIYKYKDYVNNRAMADHVIVDEKVQIRINMEFSDMTDS